MAARRLKNIGFFFLLFAVSFLASPPFVPAMNYQAGIRMETYGAAYFHDNPAGAENEYLALRMEPYLTLLPSDHILAHFSAVYQPDSQGYAESDPAGFLDRPTARPVFGLQEGYMEANRASLRLRAGKQILDWSVTDTVSPADVLSPRDWTDLLEWRRIPVTALNLSHGYDRVVELVVIPTFFPSYLPPADGRWGRELPAGLAMAEPELPPRHRGQVAARFQTVSGGTDWGIVLFHGYGYSPTARLQLAPFPQVVPVYTRQNTLALTCAREVGFYSLRTEAGIYEQEDRDDFVQYVIGLDRQWEGILDQADTFYLLVQYANEIITHRETPAGFVDLDLRRALNNALLARIRYEPWEGRRFALKIEGTWNFADHDGYFEPALEWQHDAVTVGAGLGLIWGAEESFFGPYRRNDRLFIKATFRN